MKTLRLDASALARSACALYYYRTVIEGLTENVVYNDMQYGTAFHKFVSTMYETNGDFMQAVKAAKEQFSKPCEIKSTKKYLNENHLMATCLDFWQNYVKKDDFEIVIVDGKPLVEVTFEIPYLQVGNEEGPQLDIIICGTMDKIGKFKNGSYAIGDNKVTSSWKMDEYLKPFRMLPQLRLYHWAIKTMARQNPESAIGKIGLTNVGVFIDGVFAKTGDDTKFQRSDVWFYSQAEESEFELLLNNKVRELIDLYFNPPQVRPGIIEGLCHNGYGTCKFFDLCAVTNRDAQEHIKRNNFKQREYNPLTFADE